MIKATGITRKIDDLGRLVLPRELRTNYKLDTNDVVELFTSDNQIILQKYNPGCILTGEIEDLIVCDGVKVSRQMVVKLAQAAGL